jgi:hypothetical protein
MLLLCVCCTAGNERVGDEGAIRIAETLERKTSLKELHLGGVFPMRRCCFDMKDELTLTHISVINVE